MQNDKMGCNCPHHMMMPMGIILIGLAFLFKNLGWFSAEITAYAWPIILILMGLMKIMGKSCKCCGHGQCCKKDASGEASKM